MKIFIRFKKVFYVFEFSDILKIEIDVKHSISMNNLVSKIIQMTKEKSEKYSVMYFLLFVDPEKHHYQI